MNAKRVLPLLLAAVMLLQLAACTGKTEMPENTPEQTAAFSPELPIPETPASPEIPAEQPPVTEPVPDEPEPLPEPEVQVAEIIVGELFSQSGDYTDSVGNDIQYRFAIPLLEGAETTDLMQINSELQEIYDHYAAPELESMEGGYSLVTYEIGYEVFRSEEYLSLLVYLNNDWGFHEYWCWNVSRAGDLIPNAEMLAMLGLTEEQFIEEARRQLGARVAFAPIPEELEEAAREVEEKTLAEENCNADLPMFLNAQTGALCFIAKVYSLAGADYYYHIIETELV